MAKEIILYNLADNVTDEEYKAFVTNEKGPLLESLPSVKKFELVKITGAAAGELPYKYVGIMHLTSLEEFYQKDAPSQKFQDFEKYYRDSAVIKLVLGGVQYGYFVTCRQFYDLDFSAFGPGKLQKPA